MMATETESGEREAKSRVGVGVATFRCQSRMREQPWDSETCQSLTHQNNHTDPKIVKSGAAETCSLEHLLKDKREKLGNKEKP